jgi:hypothetical protein
MSTQHGRSHGHSRMSFLNERQLTLGECIAVHRYGTSELDERRMTLGEVFSLIDNLEVCTTCGWSKRMHEHEFENEQVIGLCAHWTREL